MKAKFFLALAVLSFLVMVFGIVSACTYIGSDKTYYSSGRLMMNTQEWESFKVELSNQKSANINKVTYLDSGDSKLVVFERLVVTSDFPYGDIVLYEFSPIAIPFIVVGFIATLVLLSAYFAVK